MADTLTEFNPAAAGFRVASEPIRRKARTPSAKKQPRPQYADAVWFSYTHESPLEVEVPVRAVEDTIRKLKAAARYLERTESTKDRKVEVRVQVGAEPAPDEAGRAKHSVVKFLGHKPWVLGRRVAKVAAEESAPAPVVPAARHRRTVAGTRPPGQHRRPKASLRGPLVGSVITATEPPLSARPDVGVSVFLGSFLACSPGHCQLVIRGVPSSYPFGCAGGFQASFQG